MKWAQVVAGMAAGAATAAAGGNISTIPAASITHLKAHAFNWLILMVLVGLLRSLCTAPCFASGEGHAGIGSRPLAYLATAPPEAYSQLIDCCVRFYACPAEDALVAAELLQHAFAAACDAPEPGG
ncbi:hypothetical protein COO60DRAFT_1538041, partial [Scenedesmus sp. NREL 46B-D3]